LDNLIPSHLCSRKKESEGGRIKREMDPLQLLHGAAAVGDPNPMKRRWLDDALLSVTP